MRLSQVAGLLGLGALATSSNIPVRDYDSNDYYVLHLSPNAAPAQIAKRLALEYEGPLGELTDHHVFSNRRSEQDLVSTALYHRRSSRKRGIGGFDPLDDVRLAQKQKLKKRLEKRDVRDWPTVASRQETTGDSAVIERQKQVMADLSISDPIFHEQWHLINTVEVGHDVNVTDVWMQGITGHNSTVAIVDDGLDMYSDDLKDNYYAEGSYDFNDNTLEPKPRLSDDRHGTRCAGEVAAVRNDVCGVGVAFDSKVAGIRILSKMITDADEAVAMNYAYQHNQIYSCSWGPPDDGRSMDAPGILIKRAMLNAVQNGRDGKGSIYVFASGNGAANEDNCNFDGYTNSIYSITVGAVDRKGLHPYYSEKCSAQLAVTYSSGSNDAIVSAKSLRPWHLLTKHSIRLMLVPMCAPPVMAEHQRRHLLLLASSRWYFKYAQISHGVTCSTSSCRLPYQSTQILETGKIHPLGLNSVTHSVMARLTPGPS